MKKIFFASDFHLGIDARLSSQARERQIVRWLDQIRPEAAALYLVGDIFDFWFEYKTVVPKGYIRLLGKLAEWRDAGIPVFYFTGNHDMWMFDYLERELGIPTYRQPIVRELLGKTFYIGHGDGLGPGDYGYKRLKRLFAHPLSQWLFERLHPNIGYRLASYWSARSRAKEPSPRQFLGPEQEWLVQYANQKLDEVAADYFLFGHRHLPIDYTLKNGRSRYINLGDWLTYTSYAAFDGQDLRLLFFDYDAGQVFGKSSFRQREKQA